MGHPNIHSYIPRQNGCLALNWREGKHGMGNSWCCSKYHLAILIMLQQIQTKINSNYGLNVIIQLFTLKLRHAEQLLRPYILSAFCSIRNRGIGVSHQLQAYFFFEIQNCCPTYICFHMNERTKPGFEVDAAYLLLSFLSPLLSLFHNTAS